MDALLDRQAFYLNNHRTFAEVQRARRAKTEVIADRFPQKMLFAAGEGACPPADMAAGIKAVGMAVATRT